MAIVIIGGLATSTLLNLFVLPPLYLLVALAAVRAVGPLCLRPWGSKVGRRTIGQAGGSTVLLRRPAVGLPEGEACALRSLAGLARSAA